MKKLRLKLDLTKAHRKQPVVYHLAKDFGIVFNIAHGRFTGRSAWLVVDVAGRSRELDRALEFLRTKRVKVTILEDHAKES